MGFALGRTGQDTFLVAATEPTFTGVAVTSGAEIFRPGGKTGADCEVLEIFL